MKKNKIEYTQDYDFPDFDGRSPFMDDFWTPETQVLVFAKSNAIINEPSHRRKFMAWCKNKKVKCYNWDAMYKKWLRNHLLWRAQKR